MALQTKYIKVEDYYDYFGENLDLLFGDHNKAVAFIVRIEDRMESFLNANLFIDMKTKWPSMNDHQKECYKKALLEQAVYVFKNGDISVDSGFDPEGGVVTTVGDIRRRVIAPNAKDYLKNAGIWSQKLNQHHWPLGGMGII